MSCLGPEGDLPGWSVIREYDDAMSPSARRSAVAVLVASRSQLRDEVGQMSAQRAGLIKALRTAIQWLDLLSPLGEVPGMADLRAALVHAETPIKVSHGICLPCVQRVFPEMFERIAAKMRETPRAAGVIHVCAYCSMDCGGGQ